MQLPVYDIRGHHIEALETFLYEWKMDPNQLRKDALERGYDLETANNEINIWSEFLNGECSIKLIAGALDAICALCNIKFKQLAAGSPCDGPDTDEYDRKIASRFLLEIGKVYTYADIAKNLHNYYLDQHSM